MSCFEAITKATAASCACARRRIDSLLGRGFLAQRHPFVAFLNCIEKMLFNLTVRVRKKAPSVRCRAYIKARAFPYFLDPYRNVQGQRLFFNILGIQDTNPLLLPLQAAS